MKLIELIATSILTSVALLGATNASYPGTENCPQENSDDGSPVLSLSATPSELLVKDKVLRSAYYDTLTILNTSNNCSDFFGGREVAVDVFNKLMASVKKDYYAAGVGMRMSGFTATVRNTETNAQYRLFDSLSINLNGPFYRRRFGSATFPMYGVGTFEADSKEVRVLMLLHELGHLIKGAEGGWLLPDDGSDQDLSLRNSLKIERVCGEQIKRLSRAVNLAATSKRGSEQALVQRPCNETRDFKEQK